PRSVSRTPDHLRIVSDRRDQLLATPVPAPPAPAAARAARRGQLALLAQEILTAATRFRTGRQVAKDADGFRTQVRMLVVSADEDGRRAGYTSVDVKYALYA